MDYFVDSKKIIIQNIKHNLRFFDPFIEHKKLSEEEIHTKISTYVDKVISTDFNREWEVPFKEGSDEYKKYEDFFIRVYSHQCLACMHPLTCGVGGGSHDILVPRINSLGDLYMVCPTCGWIQMNMPI